MKSGFAKLGRGRPDVAIDFGTAHTIVVDRTGSVVFDQPSLCCFTTGDTAPKLIAAGSEAKSFLGRVEGSLQISRPLRNGVLSDIRSASELLRFSTRALVGRWSSRRLRALIGVPADATQAERKALETAALDAGMATPTLVAEPILAAIGADLDIDLPRGRMIVDCGAGITEVAVISLGGICVKRSSRGGSEELDRALSDHLRTRHRFRIGDASAERLKIQVSQALLDGSDGSVSVSGLELASGMPTNITLPITELLPLWERYIDRVVRIVRVALRETPPELARDILEDGLMITGGAALTGLLVRSLSSSTGIRVTVAPDTLQSTGLGLAALLLATDDRVGRVAYN
jgi:rod shape-determining protein MreB